MRYSLLEPLRGLAALWVFAYHYDFSESFRVHFAGLHAFFKHGDLGVPMFFVISGYCITASARSVIRRGESWTGFLRRRLRRIYPPYWFSIAVVVSLPFVIEALSAVKMGKYSPPSATNPSYGFLNFNLFDWVSMATLGQVFAPTPPGASNLSAKFTALNAVYWTLAIEVQFYLVVTLALAFRSRFYRWMFLCTAASVGSLFVPDMALSGLFLWYWPMFAAGVAVFALAERGWVPSRLFGSAAAPVSAVAAILVACGIGAGMLGGESHNGLAFSLGFAAFVFAAEGLDGWFVRSVIGSRVAPVRWAAQLGMVFGAMSYSIYLLHGKLQYLTMQPLRQVLPADSVAFDFGVIGLTCAMCYVFYRYCERPFLTSAKPESVRSNP